MERSVGCSEVTPRPRSITTEEGATRAVKTSPLSPLPTPPSQLHNHSPSPSQLLSPLEHLGMILLIPPKSIEYRPQTVPIAIVHSTRSLHPWRRLPAHQVHRWIVQGVVEGGVRFGADQVTDLE